MVTMFLAKDSIIDRLERQEKKRTNKRSRGSKMLYITCVGIGFSEIPLIISWKIP